MGRYLENRGIKFISEKTFPSCKNERPLPFDFYLPDFNCLIEIQGEQHYKSKSFMGGRSQLKKTQKHDDIKRDGLGRMAFA